MNFLSTLYNLLFGSPATPSRSIATFSQSTSCTINFKENLFKKGTIYRSKLQRIVALGSISIALFGMLGGHWMLLQGIAWERMLQTYSSQEGWQRGLLKTFSGKAPCSLCKKIAQGRQQEKQQNSPASLLKKLEGYFLSATYRIEPPTFTRYHYQANIAAIGKQRNMAPPRPHP